MIPAYFVDEILDLTCTIQGIPAPTFDEGRRAAFFLEQFHAHGLQDVQVDAVGNVLGRLPGQPSLRSTMRPLIVSAHLDTVHPLETRLDAVRTAGRITGPGIGDNALGLAALVGLARLVNERQACLPGDVWLVANVCEEGLGDLRGISSVVDRFGSNPISYLVLEGLGLGSILHRGLGVERYKIAVHTPGGHSWVDYGQPSAIHELCRLVERLASIPLPRSPCTTLNVGVIHGGISVNTIASHAWLELDLRSEGTSVLASLVQQVHAAAHNLQRPGVQVSIKRIGKREAGQIPGSHPLVELARSVLEELNLEPRPDIASTDANLPLSRGYPAVCIGISLGDNAHTMEEYFLTDPVAKGLEQVYWLVTRAWDHL